MKRLLLLCTFGGLCSTAAIAADPYEQWLTTQQQRGVEIEHIRVASEKPLVATEDTDEAVDSILDEVEALEEDVEAADEE